MSDLIPGAFGTEGPRAQLQVFTLGYEGRELADVLGAVRAHGIEEVLDVRENAFSRKKGFDAASLKERLSGMGVRYVHSAELGCERASRHHLWKGGSSDAFFDAYRRRLAEHPRAVEELVRWARASRCLLLCLEREAGRCHRRVLGEVLREHGFLVRDL